MCILLSAGLVKSLFIDRFPRVRQFSVCQERHAGCAEVQARSFGRDTAPALGRAEEAVPAGSGRQRARYHREHLVSQFVIAPCVEVGWGQEMTFLPQSPLTKPTVQWPQGDPAVSTPDCKVQGFFLTEKGTPCQLGTPLAWDKEGAQHPCLLFEIVNKLHSARLLVNFNKNILLFKCHRKAVLCAGHHF